MEYGCQKLPLQEYAIARSNYCLISHREDSVNCKGLIQAAKMILQNVFLHFSESPSRIVHTQPMKQGVAYFKCLSLLSEFKWYFLHSSNGKYP